MNLLLAEGADQSAKDSLGRRAVDWASVYNHNDVYLRLSPPETLPLQPSLSPIPIFEQGELTFDRFLKEFVQQQRPVLWRRGGEVAGMPAVLRWSTKHLIEQVCGHARVNVAPIPFAEVYNLGTRNITVREYLSQQIGENETFDYDPDFGSDIDLDRAREICAGMHFAGRAGEGSNVPEYLFAAELHRVAPNINEETDFIPREEVTYIRAPQMAIGPPGSGATMHIHLSAINTCVRGVRRWFLQPPPHAQWCTQVALEYAKQFDATPPSNRDSTILEVVQRPGDMLFVPEFWAHATVNLTNCIAIGQEFIPTGSIWT